MSTNYPPRPAATPEMILAACEKVAQKMEGADAETIAQHYQRGMDGWDLAKELDKYAYWDCTRDDMETLDEVDYLIDQAVRKAEKDWLVEHNIQPSLPIGTRVMINSDPGHGVITGVCEYSTACYLVKPEGQDDAACGNRREIIKFENAVPA